LYLCASQNSLLVFSAVLPFLAAAGDASEVLNERAMTVMKRMTDKLMGRDHVVDGSSGSNSSSDQTCDSVPAQVQRLIAQAISHENLCQSYIGWCPFW
jgi:FKBP12-rapamycin complex-associated protein